MDVVVTEKLDGECTTLSCDAIHARSLNYKPHPSRNRMKALHSEMKTNIPNGWRVCGENMTAVHSIRYEDLPHFFMVFSIWDETGTCLSWDDTYDFAQMLGLHTVPVLYEGEFDEKKLRSMKVTGEGYVVRPSSLFSYQDFGRLVGKYVRENHVQTTSNWLHKEVEYNGIKSHD
jgi:hypothetical protein